MRHFILLLLSTLSSCDIPNSKHNNKTEEYQDTSDLNSNVKSEVSNSKDSYFTKLFEETKKHKLNHRLQEISGLSFLNNKLYTHNDEEGIVFIISPENGKIVGEFKLGSQDDYEGIAINKEKVCIIKSNGKGITYNLETTETDTFTTALNEENNVEGLCFNPLNKDELLIACKGKTIKKGKNEKAIYRYNLVTKEFFDKPFLKINIKGLKKFTKNKAYSNKKKARIKEFSPSGIAIDPKSKYTYIISAKGSSLIIFEDKKLKDIVFLNAARLAQPEGICFDSKGNLYISSEGKSKKATLVKFKRIVEN